MLTLPNIPTDVRGRLEFAAAKRAVLVDALWRLYPLVINPVMVDTARVEATVRRTANG